MLYLQTLLNSSPFKENYDILFYSSNTGHQHVGWSETGKSSTRNSSGILKVAYGQHGHREYFFNTNFLVLGPPHIIWNIQRKFWKIQRKNHETGYLSLWP